MSELISREEIAPLFSRHLKVPGIYLANHSLGRPLDAMQDEVNRFLAAWYEDMDGAWGPWLETLHEYQGLVASLVGLQDAHLVTLKTSAGQGMRAVLNALPVEGAPRPVRVVATRGEFDSVDFILKSYVEKGRAEVFWLDSTEVGGAPEFHAEELVELCRTHRPDLMVCSSVHFATGRVMRDLDQVVEECRALDILTLIDAYHSFGVLPSAWPSGADFAIGGSYKYVHGGPGACWLAMSPWAASLGLRTLDTGWFAKRDLFGYGRSEHAELSTDGRAWWESTPPVIVAAQAVAGLRFLRSITVERLRATSLNQQAQLREIFTRHGLECATPDDPTLQGAFSILPAGNSHQVVEHLATRQIKVDARSGFVRFGPHPLNTVEEFETTAHALCEIALTPRSSGD